MMNVRKYVMAGIAGLVLVGLAACGNGAGDRPVVSFKGGSLTAKDLEAHGKLMGQQGVFLKNPERMTEEFILDHAVNMEMIIAKGLKENLHQDPVIRAKIHGFMSDLFLKVMQDSLVPAIDRESLTDAEVKKYFDDNLESYRTRPEYTLKIIEHQDPVFLASLKKTLDSGKMSFEDAAKAHSIDKESAKSGGNTGSRSIDSFRPDWKKAVEPLQVNQVSEPLELGKSHYLFKVVGKTEPVTPSFDEKKEYVRNDLLYSKYRDEWEKTYDRLKVEFGVRIDDEAAHAFLKGDHDHAHAH